MIAALTDRVKSKAVLGRSRARGVNAGEICECSGDCRKKISLPLEVVPYAYKDSGEIKVKSSLRGKDAGDVFVSPEGNVYCSRECYLNFVECF